MEFSTANCDYYKYVLSNVTKYDRVHPKFSNLEGKDLKFRASLGNKVDTVLKDQSLKSKSLLAYARLPWVPSSALGGKWWDRKVVQNMKFPLNLIP